MLTCNGGIPFGKLSVNLPGWEYKLENENQFFAKTWSENRFFADKLRDSKWFKDTGKWYRLNHVIVEVWELITEKGEKTVTKKTATKKTASKKQTMPKINLTKPRKRELREYAINTIIKSLRKNGDLDDFIELLQNYKTKIVKDIKNKFPESDMKVLEKYDLKHNNIVTTVKEVLIETRKSPEIKQQLIFNLREFIQFETPLVMPRRWSMYNELFKSLSNETLELKSKVEDMANEICDIIVDELCPYDQLINSKRTLNSLNTVWPEAANHFKDIWLDRIKEETKNESGQCKRMSEEAIAKKIAEHQKLLK